MSEIMIREAAAKDVADVMLLYRAAGLDTVDGFNAEEARKHFAELRRYPGYRLFVAAIAGEILGTYSLVTMDKLTKRGRSVGVVDDVGVLPGHQGEGVGRAMMAHAMEECRKASCYKLMLSSNLRRTKAHGFYDALGFARHGYSFTVALDSGPSVE